MIRNLFVTAWRGLLKNRFFTALNILGLSVGMTVFLLLALYVYVERSYEDFIPNAERLYRIRLDSYRNNELLTASAEVYPGIGPAMVKEIPEVERQARLYNLGYKNNLIVTYEDAPDPIAFRHRRFLYADSSFLPMMGYRMVAGDAGTALDKPFTAVISSTYASRYFGQENAIGKMLRMQDDDHNNELVTVTGVFEDLPFNTHIQFDILFSYSTLFSRRPDLGENWAVGRYDQSWQRKDMYCYVQLQEGADPQAVEAKLSSLLAVYNPLLKEQNRRDVLTLQPLSTIHLTSHLAEEPGVNGDSQIVNFLGIIGLFVLVIAWINYINLTTAKSMERGKEVGVRKVMGAFRWELVIQFLLEGSIINLFSMFLSIAIILLALPYFNALSGLALTPIDLTAPWFLLTIIFLWIGGSLLAGFYPALILSGFRATLVMKGKLKSSTSGIVLRRILILVQFTATIGLLAGTWFVHSQLNFMIHRDKGMDIEQVLILERPGISPRDREAYSSAVDLFRNEIGNDPTIDGLTCSLTVPGKQREYKNRIKKYGSSDDQAISVRINTMDYNFLEVYKMKVLAGRNFSKEFTNDPDTSVVITERAAFQLGFQRVEDAVGQTLEIPEFQWSPIIVGVINDYHQLSLKHSLEPTIFICSPHADEFFSLRLSTSNLTGTLENIQGAWLKAFPGNPFEYFFLDDYFNEQYSNEQKFQKLFAVFSGIAMLIGCIGLLGLSAYMGTQRTKEIGIRKVLGSTTPQLFILLSRELIWILLVAMVLAFPLVWLGVARWLETFAYKIDIAVIPYFVVCVLVLIMALLTVSFQIIKVTRINPSDTLRQD